MGKKILFWPDVYLEQGHWLPTIVWANGLMGQGHTVSYMGIRDCLSVVEPFGFLENPGISYRGKYNVIFSDLYPLGYTRGNLSTVNGRWKPDHIFAIAGGALDSIFKENSNLRPDLLVSGYFTSLESLLLYYKYKINVVISTTYLRHPQNDPAIRALENLCAFPRPVVRKLMQDVMGAAWDPNMENEEFVKPLEDSVDEVIPCPAEFDFSFYRHGDKVHYVEPCITPDEAENPSSFWNLIPTDKKLIFATAGSQVQDYEATAERLFSELIKMMNSPQMNGYHLIIGAGPKLAKKDWGSSGAYTVVSWVPQRALLSNSKTCAAIIHGGLATLKECIYFNKPFVIIPLGKDQSDNSLRVHEAGVGVLANTGAISSDNLLQAVNKAMTDPWIANRRASMSTIFNSMENTDKPGLKFILSRLGK